MEANFFKKLHPLTALAITFSFIIIVFFIEPVYLAAELALISAAAALSGFFKGYAKSAAKVMLLFLMIVIVQGFLVPSDTILWQWGAVRLYEKGLLKGLIIAGRLTVIACALLWFFSVTPVKKLTAALVEIGVEHSAAYVILSTFQMISQLSKRTKTIIDAQRSRGLETEGNMFMRGKAYIPIIGPLVISSLLSTEERALTLESRGFSAPVKKTSFTRLTKSKADWVMTFLFLGCALIIIVGSVLKWTP